MPSWASKDHSIPHNTPDFWGRVGGLDVEVCTVNPFCIADIAGTVNVPDVIQSDIVRLILLSQVGGLWSDMDILYFRPVEVAFEPSHATAYFCKHKLTLPDGSFNMQSANSHRIGLLLGAPHNRHFANLLRKAKGVWDSNRYQSLGTGLYKHNVDMGSSDLANIPMCCVYPDDRVDKMFMDATPQLLKKIQSKTIGWHWYGGNPIAGHHQNVIVEDNFQQFNNSPIVNLLRRIVHG